MEGKTETWNKLKAVFTKGVTTLKSVFEKTEVTK